MSYLGSSTTYIGSRRAWLKSARAGGRGGTFTVGASCGWRRETSQCVVGNKIFVGTPTQRRCFVRLSFCFLYGFVFVSPAAFLFFVFLFSRDLVFVVLMAAVFCLAIGLADNTEKYCG